MGDTSSLMPRVGFACLTAWYGYLIYLCLRPPNPRQQPGKRANVVRDTIMPGYAFLVLQVSRTMFLAATIWQAVYIVFPFSAHPSGSFRTAPRPRPQYPLNQTLLTPNALSVPLLLFLSAAAALRLRAFSLLGKDFTFDLRVPNRLETGGLYAYVQHPGYSAGFVAIAGSALWFGRCDGVMGTILPDWMMRNQWFWNWYTPSGASLFMVATLGLRVMEEEQMLRDSFGKEWEVWHAKTARFVPGVF